MRADIAVGFGALRFIFGLMRMGVVVNVLVSFLLRVGGLASFS